MKPLDENRMRLDRVAAAQEASEIIRLHQADDFITELEIAFKLGLTEYGVRWLLMDRGFEPRHERPKPPKPTTPAKVRIPKAPTEAQLERRRHVVELYQAGNSLRQIAQAIGVTKDRIRQILVYEGVKRRVIGNRNNFQLVARSQAKA